MADSATVINISSSAPAQKLPSSSHRLPTVSASDALASLDGVAKTAVSSGIDSLNHALVGDPNADNGGFERGKVAEIWGPTGAGKTALVFQAASRTINSDHSVAWIDAAAPLSSTRLSCFTGKTSGGASDNDKGQAEYGPSNRFHHLSVRTLSHLLALVLHPPTEFLPQGTTLLVIDNLHTLIDLDYPRMSFGNGSRSDQQKWQAGRRYAILGSLVTAFSKLAVLHNMAVIVTTGSSSRPRGDSGLAAAIGPGVGGSEWEGGIWSRTVLFRDFNGRFAGVQKCSGRNLTPLDPVGDIRHVVGFEISAEGWLKEQVIDLTSSAPGENQRQPTKTASSPVKVVRKRHYEEIADSDEDADEYGWAEKDEDAIAGGALTDEHKPGANDTTTTQTANDGHQTET